MSTQEKVAAALFLALATVLATWGSREVKFKQQITELTTQRDQFQELSETSTAEVTNLNLQLNEKTQLLQQKDEEIKLATRTQRDGETTRRPDGTTITTWQTVTDSQQDTQSKTLDQYSFQLTQLQAELQTESITARTYQDALHNLEQTITEKESKTVKSAPSLAALIGYAIGGNLKDLQIGAGIPIGALTLGLELSPGNFDLSQSWGGMKPQIQTELRF